MRKRILTEDDLKRKLSEFTEDSTHRTVTDAEKNKWNNKAEKSYVDSAKSSLSSDFTNKYNALNNAKANKTDLGAYAKNDRVTALERNMIKEADVRRFAAEVAYSDYLFTQGKGLGANLNKNFGTRFSSNINSLNDLVNSDAALTELCSNKYAIEAGLNSGRFLNYASGSDKVLNKIFANDVSVNSLSNNVNAADVLANSQKAINIMFNNNTILSKLLNYETVANSIANSDSFIGYAKINSPAITKFVSYNNGAKGFANSNKTLSNFLTYYTIDKFKNYPQLFKELGASSAAIDYLTRNLEDNTSILKLVENESFMTSLASNSKSVEHLLGYTKIAEAIGGSDVAIKALSKNKNIISTVFNDESAYRRLSQYSGSSLILNDSTLIEACLNSSQFGRFSNSEYFEGKILNTSTARNKFKGNSQFRSRVLSSSSLVSGMMSFYFLNEIVANESLMKECVNSRTFIDVLAEKSTKLTYDLSIRSKKFLFIGASRDVLFNSAKAQLANGVKISLTDEYKEKGALLKEYPTYLTDIWGISRGYGSYSQDEVIYYDLETER